MADFDPFSHGKYWCPYLDERIWTEFSKRIRPGAHRARIAILTFSCMCREYILYVQRTYCMCREYILYVQRIHISQNNIFSKNNILYIFPKPVDPQNFRSSISPNSRARGAGIHTKTCGTSNILERISSLFSTNSGESSYCIFRRKTSKNTQSHRPTKMWNEYNVFLKNTLLKNSVYYI